MFDSSRTTGRRTPRKGVGNVNRRVDRSSCLWGGWGESDVLAEAFELCDESADVGLVGQAAGEVVAAEVAVGLFAVEQVVGDDESGVADGDGGAFLASSAGQAPVLRGEVGELCSGGGMGGLDQGGAEPFVALAGVPGAVLAGR